MLSFYCMEINMKNYYYKLIYIFSIIELAFIAVFSVIMFKMFNVQVSDVLKIVCGFLFALFLFYLLLRMYVKMNILDPMSRMLNSPDGVSYDNDADLYRVIAYLRKNLKAAKDEKKKTDTILEHMADRSNCF